MLCETNYPVDCRATVVKRECLSNDVTLITLACPAIAAAAKPGNFVNIKVNDAVQPLLRRPFSIHNVHGDNIEVMVKAIGQGTTLLSNAIEGTSLMMLGPLGNCFEVSSKPFRTAILVSGGIGTAPMLFLEKKLIANGKKVINLIGGRTKDDLLIHKLTNCHVATDDGSAGFTGTVVELLRHKLAKLQQKSTIKVFACGPTPMLKALANFCHEQQLACELSLEAVMGCGIGICYGCTVHVNNRDGEPDTMLLCQKGAIIDSELLADKSVFL